MKWLSCLLVVIVQFAIFYMLYSIWLTKENAVIDRTYAISRDMSLKLDNSGLDENLYNNNNVIARSIFNRVYINHISDKFIRNELLLYKIKDIPKIDLTNVNKPIKLDLPSVSDTEGPEMIPVDLTKKSLFEFMIKANSRQLVYNKELLPSMKYVMVIQVHNRVKYLRILIHSLIHVHNIQRVLLIFSHDYYLAEINELINLIKFAPVMQIYFPLNSQIFNQSFPGSYHGVKTRNSKFTQLKHHWTFKMSFVFQSIRILEKYNKRIIFLEDDYYVVEDILHIYDLMHNIESVRGRYNLMSFGTFKTPNNWNSLKFFETSFSTLHNLGLGFDRTFWKHLYTVKQRFCNFNDYNWDWSLTLTIVKNKMLGVLQSNRVIHIGSCGTHSHRCNRKEIYLKVHNELVMLRPHLFKDARKSNANIPWINFPRRPKSWKGWGGWEDKRDRKLCLEIFKQSEKLYDFYNSSHEDPFNYLEDFLMTR